MFKKDIFGRPVLLREFVIRAAGTMTYFNFNLLNKVKITGAEILKDLPKNRVLFVANHQTYFADVLLLYHIFESALAGFPNTVAFPGFLLCPKSELYYVAADETVKNTAFPAFFQLTGAIRVKRTWREAGKEIKRPLNKKDPTRIAKALRRSWVITFPQGTTKPFAPGRKGTAHIIKHYRPIVVPVVIDGTLEAFGKKGLFIKKTGVKMSVRFKKPLEIDYEAPVEEILAQVMDAIEQSEKYKQLAIKQGKYKE